MPLEETMFSRAQMNVPAELPEILKQYTKAAIRTQPEKLLEWSAAYFTALKEGKPLPVKTRYEMGAATGLTFGILNILNRQLGPPRSQPVPIKELREKWQDLGLTEESLDKICTVGDFGLQTATEIDMEKFVVVAASSLVECSEQDKNSENKRSGLHETLNIACQLFTNDLEGGASRIKVDQFIRIFTFMSNIMSLPAQSQSDVIEYMTSKAESQGGQVMPANFQSKDCPTF